MVSNRRLKGSYSHKVTEMMSVGSFFLVDERKLSEFLSVNCPHQQQHQPQAGDIVLNNGMLLSGCNTLEKVYSVQFVSDP